DAGAAVQRRRHPRAGGALQPQRIAVFHRVEEHRGAGGRLCHGSGAGHELPEPEDVRAPAGEGACTAAGRALAVYVEAGSIRYQGGRGGGAGGGGGAAGARAAHDPRDPATALFAGVKGQLEKVIATKNTKSHKKEKQAKEESTVAFPPCLPASFLLFCGF